MSRQAAVLRFAQRSSGWGPRLLRAGSAWKLLKAASLAGCGIGDDDVVSPLFTHTDAWTGGDYDLEIDLGCRSDACLGGALGALWSHPDLRGPFAHDDVEPAEQAAVAPDGNEVQFGVARVPGGAEVACRCVAVANDEEGDLVVLGLPLGSLSQAWPQVGGYPFLDVDEGPETTQSWQEPLESWLGAIGLHIAQHAPCEAGFVCFEGPGLFNVDLASWRRSGIPDERPYGLLWPDDGGTVRWYPATLWGGFEPLR